MNRVLNFTKPLIMGVINLSPDSYYSPSTINTDKQLIERIESMLAAGVDIIDLGAASSRPGAPVIPVNEELLRLKKYLPIIQKQFPNVFLSIDTFHSSVAEFSLDLGAQMINDITAFEVDKTLPSTIAKYNAYYCLMHMQKSPSNMQDNPQYEDVTKEVFIFLKNKLSLLKKAGVEKIMIDPGLGFGKSMDHNYRLLKDLAVFKIFELPIMVGLSRKSMIYKLLDVDPEETLPATTALHLYALQQGASILRVHDVLEAKQSIQLFHKLKTNNN